MPKTRVDLRNPHHPWAEAERAGARAWAKGFAWFEGHRLRAADLADRLCDVAPRGSAADAAALADFARGLNGSFALAIQGPDGALAATDRLRSMPLFHARRGDEHLLADDAFRARAYAGDGGLDELALTEYLLTGYVTGRETLSPGVRQVQAAEVLRIPLEAGAEPEDARYFRLFHGELRSGSLDDFVEAMDAMLVEVFGRFVESLDGRRVVIPLSGGFDSRLIATMLKRLGYDRVSCYVFGQRSSFEVKISREVARRLGFDWKHVRWTRGDWRRWYRTPEREAFTRYSGNLVSSAFVVDWPIVRALLDAGHMDGDDVLAPGHSGDFLGGSHLPPSFLDAEVDVNDVVEGILRRHYSLWQWRAGNADLEKVLRDRVQDRMELHALPESGHVTSGFEKWDWQERQSKHIVNSARAYEWWGLDWRIPLWDHEMIEFFMRVPLELRVGKKLYDRYVDGFLFPRFGVSGLYRRTNRFTVAVSWLLGPKTFADPRMGRHPLRELAESWRLRTARFGNGWASRAKLTDPISLAVVSNLEAFTAGPAGSDGR